MTDLVILQCGSNSYGAYVPDLPAVVLRPSMSEMQARHTVRTAGMSFRINGWDRETNEADCDKC